MNKEYFTTGEFSKLFNIKKQTLFHYDDIGIFKPEIKAENGYRYYSYTQLESFSVLLMFKELQVPLKEIKELMDNRSPQNLIDILEEKKIEINEKINRLEHGKKYIDEKIKITKEGINAPLGKVVFEQIPDEYLVTTDYAGESNESDVATAVSKHFAYCKELGLQGAYAIGGIIPIKSVTKENYNYSKFYTTVDTETLHQTGYDNAFLDKGGTYIAYYDNHGYDNVCAICNYLMNYAKKNHLKLDDSFYEDIILDDLSTEGYYNYLVKLSARVI